MISTGCIKTIVKDGCHINFQVFSCSHFEDMWLSCISFYSSKLVLALNIKGLREKGHREISVSSHAVSAKPDENDGSCLGYIGTLHFHPYFTELCRSGDWRLRNFNHLKWNKEMWLKSGVKIVFNKFGKDRAWLDVIPCSPGRGRHQKHLWFLHKRIICLGRTTSINPCFQQDSAWLRDFQTPTKISP